MVPLFGPSKPSAKWWWRIANFVESISVQRHPAAKNRNPQGGNFSATECPIRASNQRTPGPTTQLLSMAPSNKKHPKKALGGASATPLPKNIQGGGPPNSGTAVASAKAVQSVIPKAAKGIHAGGGSQGVSISNGSWS